MTTTSLKLPEDIKTLAVKLASEKNVSVHALLVDAVREVVIRDARKKAFLDEARTSLEEMLRTGKGYDAGEMHEHLGRLASGKKSRRPRETRWRA